LRIRPTTCKQPALCGLFCFGVRDAFRLLHQRYPDNEWTLKTPYYF
jgi:hypothetical protein